MAGCVYPACQDDQEGKFFKQAQTQGKVDSYVELLKFRVPTCSISSSSSSSRPPSTVHMTDGQHASAWLLVLESARSSHSLRIVFLRWSVQFNSICPVCYCVVGM